MIRLTSASVTILLQDSEQRTSLIFIISSLTRHVHSLIGLLSVRASYYHHVVGCTAGQLRFRSLQEQDISLVTASAPAAPAASVETRD